MTRACYLHSKEKSKAACVLSDFGRADAMAGSPVVLVDSEPCDTTAQVSGSMKPANEENQVPHCSFRHIPSH